MNLSFNVELSSAIDTNTTLVSNIGRAIIKKLAVKFEGNEIMSVDKSQKREMLSVKVLSLMMGAQKTALN